MVTDKANDEEEDDAVEKSASKKRSAPGSGKRNLQREFSIKQELAKVVAGGHDDSDYLRQISEGIDVMWNKTRVTQRPDQLVWDEIMRVGFFLPHRATTLVNNACLV